MPGNNNNDSNSTSNNNLNDSNGENSFYDDNNAQFGSRTTSEGTSLNGSFVSASGNTMKRPMSLDLNSSKNAAKKQRLNQSSIPTPVLESPDLQSLKFTTPDIEKFILSNNLLLTPTPSGNSFPPKVFNNFQVTTEQEGFAKGFVDALNSLRNNDNTQSHTNGTSGGSITYTDLDVPYPPVIKEEPQTVPSSPPLSPIDMQDQEKIKLERKRQRNRVAASKCRKRKLERISKLEDKVKVLKSENTDLGSVIKQMKEHVMQLKQQVIDHIHAGCSVQLYNSSTVLQSK